eukprot:evm.model.scf_1715.3 EVM.evm.TU.scf_1715.3   scf_1715:25542-25856(-)
MVAQACWEATSIPAMIQGIVKSDVDDDLLAAALGALINIALPDEQALARLAGAPTIAKLLHLSVHRKGTAVGQRACLLLSQLLSCEGVHDEGMDTIEAVSQQFT